MHICNMGQVRGQAKKNWPRKMPPAKIWPESCFSACPTRRQILISIFHHVLFNRGCLKCIYAYACHFAGENSVDKFTRLKKKYGPSCLHWLALSRGLVILQDLDLAFMPGLFLCLNWSINPNRSHALHACWHACLQVAVGIFLGMTSIYHKIECRNKPQKHFFRKNIFN